MIQDRFLKDKGWLLFFYSLPSKPVNARIKIWRRLAKAGAIQFKGAVYVLPDSEEHYEFLQWLSSEVISLTGDAAFIRTGKIETMTNRDIFELFNQQRDKEYKGIEKGMEELERKINSIKKGAGAQNIRKISNQFHKYKKESEDILKIDFFFTKAGKYLQKKIKALEIDLKSLSGFSLKEQVNVSVAPKRIEDYHRKIWITRKRPFVDRMASAWLIKRFIDKNARIKFIDEREIEKIDKDAVTFDIRGGEFTHKGDMCTFEVIIKAFGLKNTVLKKIAEIVHEIDIKDDKYKNPEGKGIEEILIGIRKTSKDDKESLEMGMAVFEMLYASKI